MKELPYCQGIEALRKASQDSTSEKSVSAYLSMLGPYPIAERKKSQSKGKPGILT